MTYEEKKKIADKYLLNNYGVTWNSLVDINSLHDCEIEKEIIDAAEDRYLEDQLS